MAYNRLWSFGSTRNWLEYAGRGFQSLMKRQLAPLSSERYTPPSRLAYEMLDV